MSVSLSLLLVKHSIYYKHLHVLTYITISIMSTEKENLTAADYAKPAAMSNVSNKAGESRDTPSVGLGTHAKDNEKTDLQEASTSGRSTASVTVIMLALCMATFLAALDVAVVTTALPYIAKDFNASQSAYSWIGSAYLLTYAAITPFWAKCSDIFGRKPILLLANVIFLVGSLVCALAHSGAMLIAGRAVQGAGGGGLIILVNITISDLFSMR